MKLALAALLAVLTAGAAQAETTDEKRALAREIAAQSLLATLGPLQTAAEVEQIIAEAPDLTAQEQEDLRRIGQERAQEIGQQALAAEAEALASALSVDDLRAIAAFERSPAASHRREVTPTVVGSVMQVLAGVDYKAEVRRAFCESTGKLCE